MPGALQYVTLFNPHCVPGREGLTPLRFWIRKHLHEDFE